MDLGLRDKVAIITGGSVGIGLAVAEGLAAEGANIVLVARDKTRVDDEAARIADTYGVITHGVAADVATAEGCDAVIAGARQAFGGADILINNAGTGSNETIQEALGRSAKRPAGFENIEALPQRFELMTPDVAKVKEFIARHTGL